MKSNEQIARENRLATGHRRHRTSHRGEEIGFDACNPGKKVYIDNIINLRIYVWIFQN